ncbi:nucleotide-binding oligomerization domain-containing protein 1 [Osmerus mordax]|uniref:nucleotide-binding oligomerization domain-containing protein 1 n=1 Tax=Osmerus mordax TaxID=8014 RepID=UPI00350EC4D8
MRVNASEEATVPQLMSTVQLLTWNRELLVSQVKSTQCILDNLLKSGFFCQEDVETVQPAVTKADQVRKILEIVQSKGEPACEYFLYILYKVYDAYIDLQPWLQEINYQPPDFIQEIPVVNTDPISRYCEKLRHELRRDTRFIASYSQREETLLEELYTDTQMELLDGHNESLGYLESLDQLLGERGVFNPEAETVFVTGDAGVGKSLLLQKVQNLWSKRELRTDVMFFFKFRCRMFSTFKKTDEISLRDLLFKHNCYPDQDLDNEVFGYILRFPEKVLFTFDGYDEVQGELDLVNVPEVVSPEDKSHPLLLLINLLCGKLLKGSQKVLTARTGTEVLAKVIRKRVALQGFSLAHLKTYTSLHFKEQEHRDLVWVQLDASPHLCGLCSTPLFCWIVFKSFKHLHTVYDDFQLPETCVTLTNIFLLLSEVFLSRSALPPAGMLKRSTRCAAETFQAGSQRLVAFAKLALLGLERGGFVFSLEEAVSCGLAEADLHVGFLRPVSCYDGTGSSDAFEFLHLTLQSFLAAFALVLEEQAGVSSTLRFFTKCSRKKDAPCLPWASCVRRSSKPRGTDPFKTNDHLQFANLFLCGLLAKANAGLLEHLVSPALLDRKRSILKSYLSTSVRCHLRGLPVHTTDNEGSKVHVLPNFLWMLRCIFETGSREVAQLTAKGITASYIKLGYCNIYSGDCSALNYVLQHRKKRLGVDMDNNNISDYGVKQLRPSLSTMTVVRLSVNQISDSSVEILAEELTKHKVVEVLGLYKNLITDVGAELVAKMIEECPKLRTVKIGSNKITSVGGTYLAQAIQKSSCIFDVGMWGNTIGDKGAVAFAEALRHHPSLTNLSLSANGITSRGGRSLAQALKENTVLRIFWLVQNQLTDDVAPDMAELIKANTGLSHLWLINNQLTVAGMQILSDALPYNTALKEICVKGNSVSQEEEALFKEQPRLRFH